MQQPQTEHEILLRFFYPLLLLLIIILPSCKREYIAENKNVAYQLKIADNFITSGKRDSCIMLLAKLRPAIHASDPALCDYYCFLAEVNSDQPDKMTLYADSAMVYFNNGARKNKYPNQYYKSLLARGDAYFKNKQFNQALKFYYEARKIFSVGNCEDGYLSTKMAAIYYSQKNFSLSARYWAESAKLLAKCNSKMSLQKSFFSQQGALNNSGVAYEKSGRLDSAGYYYRQDLELINRTKHLNKNIDVSSALVIVYDNLGGLYLKQSNLPLALDYLNKCLAIPVKERDGIKIPPTLKLAELYMITGEDEKAVKALNTSRYKLNLYARDNPGLVILWNKLYSQYLLKQGRPSEAYQYQNTYIRLRDSLDRTWAGVYRLDVNRELNSIYQQQTLNDLSYKNKEKKIYLVGILVIAVMLFVILFLIYRNLKRSQNIQKSTILHNEELQHALAELERANQNYIRIMRVMAHDLRNPISGMTGLAALLQDEDEFTMESKHMLRLIETTGTHSMEMISELLSSGLANENEIMEVTQLDVKSLLHDSVELLQFKANEKKQQILFESENLPVLANVNHEKIWRVFNNLIVNAIKFSHEGSIIKVNIFCKNKNLLVSVADNGIGIADKDKDSVFEMFTPAKKVGTNGEQPFGLGLSISKKIIDMHHGKIWFESVPPSGTTFYIQLPCAG